VVNVRVPLGHQRRSHAELGLWRLQPIWSRGCHLQTNASYSACMSVASSCSLRRLQCAELGLRGPLLGYLDLGLQSSCRGIHPTGNHHHDWRLAEANLPARPNAWSCQLVSDSLASAIAYRPERAWAYSDTAGSQAAHRLPGRGVGPGVPYWTSTGSDRPVPSRKMSDII
jgi:hypothetical protein